MNGAGTFVDETSKRGNRRDFTPEARARISPVRGVLLLFLLGFTSGCYTTTPIASAPTPGEVLDLKVTDEGRVTLGKQVGPQVSSIEGVLDSASDSAYSLKVRSVTYLNGQTNTWNGEKVVVLRNQITTPRERRFSAGKTALAALIAAAGVGLFIATRSILGSGNPDTGEGGNGGGGTDQFRFGSH